MRRTLSEQQISSIAFDTLEMRDARIFMWHHFGARGVDNGVQWTFGKLASHFKVSFSTISKSLRASAPIMREAVIQAELQCLEINVNEGLSEEDAPLCFVVSLQFGSKSVPRVDVTQKQVVLHCRVWDRED